MNRETYIKLNMKGKVLDVGCIGSTNIGKLGLHDIIDNENVWGLDIVLPTKKMERFIQGDAENMPIQDNSFDTIVAGELIEHLNNPEKFLEKSQKILRKDGIIIITTPNKNSLINRLFHSYEHRVYHKQRELSKETNFLNESGLHKQLFTKNTIEELIEKNNRFKVLEILYFPYTKLSSDATPKAQKLYFLRKLLHYLLPKSLQENILIKAEVIK